MSTLAFFLALGGVSWAAGVLPPNSVGSLELQDGAVSPPKLAAGSVGVQALDPTLRTALGVSTKVGNTVVSASGTVLGTLVKKYSAYAVGLSLPQPAFSIRKSDGQVVERIVATGDQAYATDRSFVNLFAYRSADCSGVGYVPLTSASLSIFRTKPFLSSPNGPRDPSSPFAAAYGPVGNQTGDKRLEQFHSARLFGGGASMYTPQDGACRSGDLQGYFYGYMLKNPKQSELNPFMLDPKHYAGYFKVSRLEPITDSLAGPLSLQ